MEKPRYVYIIGLVVACLALAVLTICPVILTACSSSGPTPEKKALEKEREAFEKEMNNQTTASRLVNHLIYVKDPRTNTCFAHYSSSASYAGYYISTIATVPCEAIPPRLLITPKVN